MASERDWQLVGQVLAGKTRVMIHQRDGQVRLKLRLLAVRDEESGLRTGVRGGISAVFDSGTCEEFDELRELFDQAKQAAGI